MTFFKIAFESAGSKYQSLIRTNNSEISVRRQCELLGITRSTIYYRPDCTRHKLELEFDEKVMRQIDYWHTEMPYLGSRKILRKLREEGFEIGRKRVRRLMIEMGITAIYPKPNLSKRDFRESIVPYLLRNKRVFMPNQVWSIDITYVALNHGNMYLTAIIDWYSRMIVGWNLSDTLDTTYVLQAVREAVQKYGIPGIINSDQGSQFTSKEYKKLLQDLNIRQSMDGKSRWADNIMIERWFRNLKTEEIYINEYANPKELRRAIGKYVEQYNHLRRHPIKFCVNNNPSSNNKTADCGAIRLSDLPRVNFSFLSAECYARFA